MIGGCFIEEAANCFPKWLYHFIFLSAMHENRKQITGGRAGGTGVRERGISNF